MNTAAIIAALDDEIGKLTHARNLLNGVDQNPARAVKHRVARVNNRPASVPSPVAVKRTGGMTPEGRKRIADAMRARWAEKRGTVKAIKSVKK